VRFGKGTFDLYMNSNCVCVCETRDMLVFDYLLYKTQVFGRHMTGNYKDFFRYNEVKKLPNGIPTMKTQS